MNRSIKNKTLRASGKPAQRKPSPPSPAGPKAYDGRANTRANEERVSPNPPGGRGQKQIDWEK